MFVDEAGLYQLPAAVRTYAPRGETPVLRAPLDYDHLSAISGITQAGTLYMRVFEKSISGEEVVQFLRHVLREVSGKLTIVWDGLPAHWGSKVQAFLSEGAAQRLHLEQLPGYAPDLNPDEGVWNYLKNVEMKFAAGGSTGSKPSFAGPKSGFVTKPRSSRASIGKSG